MRKKGLKWIIDSNTEVLILGTLPGDESIRQRRYYAQPSNRFWKLVSEAIGEDITKLDYDNKIEKLKGHKIGLWDIFESGEREGSSDSKIRNGKMNSFSELKQAAPNIRLVCFNGKKAGSYESLLHKEGYKTKVLPSSSGANRQDTQKRILEWKSILKY